MGKVSFSQLSVCPRLGGTYPGLWSQVLSQVSGPVVFLRGYSCPRLEGGTQVTDGGFSSTRQRGTPVPGGGYPISGFLQTRQGYPPPPQEGQDWSTPRPKTEQQSEYLLHGGRYASCVRAGGLSCSSVSFCGSLSIVSMSPTEGHGFL